MLRARRVCTCHVMQLYDILFVSSSLVMRLVLRVPTIGTIGRAPHVRSRALPADNAARSAHKATEQSVVNQLAYDRTNRRSAGSKDADLDFDEGPHACCGDANWKESVAGKLQCTRYLTSRVHDLIFRGKFSVDADVGSRSASSDGSFELLVYITYEMNKNTYSSPTRNIAAMDILSDNGRWTRAKILCS